MAAATKAAGSKAVKTVRNSSLDAEVAGREHGKFIAECVGDAKNTVVDAADSVASYIVGFWKGITK